MQDVKLRQREREKQALKDKAINQMNLTKGEQRHIQAYES